MDWNEETTERFLERGRDAQGASDRGRRVFERQENPVPWAAAILADVATIRPGVAEVDAILRCAAKPRRWKSGHERFFERHVDGISPSSRSRGMEP